MLRLLLSSVVPEGHSAFMLLFAPYSYAYCQEMYFEKGLYFCATAARPGSEALSLAVAWPLAKQVNQKGG
jgi:hypothetical protein